VGVQLASSLLGMLAPAVPPIVVALIYARQARRSDSKIGQAMATARQRAPKYVEVRPRRWYDLVVVGALLGTPFVQWFAFLKYHTRLSFLLPLGIALSLFCAVSILSPQSITELPKDVQAREKYSVSALAGVLLVVALLLPPSGMIIIMRGILTDLLALIAVSHLIRAVQRQKFPRQA
jgi:hypothetical protein